MRALGRAIPVRPCVPWCITTQVAHRQEHPVDRICWSEFLQVPLTLHRPVDCGTPGNRWGYDKLDVLARRQHGAEAPEVVLHRESGCEGCERDQETVLTLEEAQALRGRLDELLKLAEG